MTPARVVTDIRRVTAAAHLLTRIYLSVRTVKNIVALNVMIVNIINNINSLNLNKNKMSIVAKKSGGEFKRVNPGTYAARCYSMLEIGTITQEYLGEPKRRHEVMLTWELPTELEVFHEDKGAEPYVVSKTYTLSMHEKATLRRDLESWRGKGFTEKEAEAFDITVLMGKPCMLSIIHKPGKVDPSKTYVEIASISSLPKGLICDEQINPTRLLSFDNWDAEIYEGLSDYLKEKIASSEEYKTMNSGFTDAIETPAKSEIDPLPF